MSSEITGINGTLNIFNIAKATPGVPIRGCSPKPGIINKSNRTKWFYLYIKCIINNQVSIKSEIFNFIFYFLISFLTNCHSLYSSQNTLVSFEYFRPTLKFHNQTDIVQPCRFHSFWSEVVSWKIFAGSFFALKKCNRTIVFTFSSCRYTLVSSVAKSN